MAKETITVELSAKDRQLIRELIAAVKVHSGERKDAQQTVMRLIEQSRGGFAEAARAEGGKFAEAARSLWNDTGAIYWGDEPDRGATGSYTVPMHRDAGTGEFSEPPSGAGEIREWPPPPVRDDSAFYDVTKEPPKG